MSVTIKYADALSLFKAIGSSRAATWNAEKMAAQCGRLPKIVDAESSEIKSLTGENAKTFDLIVDAVEREEVIVISGDSATAVTKPKRRESVSSATTKSSKKGEAVVSTSATKTRKAKGTKATGTKATGTKATGTKATGTKAKSTKAKHRTLGKRGHTAKDWLLSLWIKHPTNPIAWFVSRAEGKLAAITVRTFLYQWRSLTNLPSSAADIIDKVKVAAKKAKKEQTAR